jgi:mevalonate kinase
MLFLLFLVLSPVSCDIFLQKSLQITKNFNTNLTPEISQIIKSNYYTWQVVKCKNEIKNLILSSSNLEKRTKNEDAVREMTNFVKKNPKISRDIVQYSGRILNSVKNYLSNLKKDQVIIPVLYSLGFLTTGYVLGMFNDIKLYFQKKN